jgi:hypothetical protein
VIAAPADFGVNVSADDGRALLPGELLPELAADGSPLPPAVFAGHGKVHLMLRGVKDYGGNIQGLFYPGRHAHVGLGRAAGKFP